MNGMHALVSRIASISMVVCLATPLLAQVGLGAFVAGGVAGAAAGARFAAELARQAAWDRANEEWFIRNGFDASRGRSNYEWDDWSLQPMRAPGETQRPSLKTFYELGNQAPYMISMGPVLLRYRGAVVRMIEGHRIKVEDTEVGSNPPVCDGSFNWLHAYSGWNTDFMPDPNNMEEGQGVGIYKTAWMKGYLTRSAVQTLVDTNPDSCGRYGASYVYRYQYHAPNGAVIAFFQRPQEVSGLSHYSAGCGPLAAIAPEPNFYWSSDGNASLDTSNKCKPVIRWADGSMEEFHGAITEIAAVPPPPVVVAPPFELTCSAAETTADLRRIDRNGNVTWFRYSVADDGRLVEKMTDSQGRVTVLSYNLGAHGMPRLQTVELPSIGNAPPLRYTVEWRTLQVNFSEIWPHIACSPERGASPGCTLPIPVEVIESVFVPDGRRYFFEYGPWGNITRVYEPGGSVHEFEYGDADNFDYAASVVPLVNRMIDSELCGPLWSGASLTMQAHGLVRERVYPEGIGAGKPSHVQEVGFEQRKLAVPGCGFDGLGAATAGPDGCSQVWMVTKEPDGTIKKSGSVTRAIPFFRATARDRLAVPPTAPVDVHGRSLGQETWDGNRLVAAHYNGDKDTGVLWYESEFVKIVNAPMAISAGVRATKAVAFADGLSTTTNFVHGESVDIAPGPAVELRATAVTAICIFAGVVAENGCSPANATPLLRTEMTYKQIFDESLRSQHLLNLTASKRVYGPTRVEPFQETTFAYDEFDVASSGRPSSVLDPGLSRAAGTNRGNMTTTTQRISASKSVSTKTRYFDTGDVASVTDPMGRAATYAPDFDLCSASSPTFTSTITNALGHVATTVSDCWSDLMLATTDENGNSTYTQYDYLGRAVESASAGDVLTALPTLGLRAYTRDPAAPTGQGTRVGQARVTAWTEYLEQGVLGRQRIVEYVRDGSADGHYKKVFLDGRGRVVQTRTETDASKNGKGEVVVTSIYDGLGRVSSKLSPCFADPSDVQTAHCGTSGVSRTYDVLGRELTVTEPGNRVTTYQYGHEDGQWLQTSTNPRGFKTKTFNDLLGRTVRVARQSTRCGGEYCSNTATYDVVGRLLTQTDPGGNTVTYDYDDLGRRKWMKDPDLGHWSYEYDDNGNLTSQVDARGQKISFKYDELNRMTLKDLPPEGASAEDLSFHYDGRGPTPPVPVSHPAPTVATITPSTTVAGGAAFTLTVDGTNFISGSVVRFNGQSRQTTFVSAARLTADIPASDIQAAGTFDVTVATPLPGGGVSNALPFVVQSPAPPPTISAMTPSEAAAGGPAFTLTVDGSNFAPGAVVRVNQQNRQTTFVSATRLTAEIPALDIQNAGGLDISVSGGSGVSNIVRFTVHARPFITTVTPSQAVAGSPAFTLTIDGGNFVAGAVVSFKQENRQTTFVSATRVTAQILATDIQTVGDFPVVVTNPAPQAGVSNAAMFTVKPPPPEITSVSPSVVEAGSANVTLTVNGKNFVADSRVAVNNVVRATTFVSSSQLLAEVFASEMQQAGTRTVIVSTGPVLSNQVTIRVNGRPQVTLASPRSLQRIVLPAAVPFRANVVDDEAGSRVGYYANGTLIGASSVAPDYAFDWSNAPVGQYSVKARVQDIRGSFSESSPITIFVDRPRIQPTITSISPSTVAVGAPGFTLTINGSDFESPVSVTVDGQARKATFVSSTRVTVEIAALDVATEGGRTIVLTNASGPTSQVLLQVASRYNVALAANGGQASASSTGSVHSLAAVNNGDRRGPKVGGIWADATPDIYPDWVQIDFPQKLIDEVSIFSLQDGAYSTTTAPPEPTETMTGSRYVVANFVVQYWTDSGWVTPPGGTVNGNNRIWRRVTFPEVATNKVRVTVQQTPDNYTQIPEIEVWGHERANIAHASRGSVATASSTTSVHSTVRLNDGNRKGPELWADNTPSDYQSDWIQIDFPSVKTVSQVALFSLQDTYPNVVEPTPEMTGARFVVQDFYVMYWAGDGWAALGDRVTGNNRIWKTTTAWRPVTTDKIRIHITKTADNYSQVVEVEVYE